MVVSHVSAASAAILPILSILDANFGGIRSCGYTFIKSIKTNKAIKCPSLGPGSYTDPTAKWDFSTNLVPSRLPSLDEELFRVMPSLHGKLTCGLCVFAPTECVSMIDLVVGVGDQRDHLYRDVCMILKQASHRMNQSVFRYCCGANGQMGASGAFVGDNHAAVVDGGAGGQIGRGVVKLVIWFDNEVGVAARVVDLVREVHFKNC